MAKARLQYICRSCGSVQSRWMGKCPDCGEWDSLEEYRNAAGSQKDEQRGSAGLGTAADVVPQAVPINEIDETLVARIPTNIRELDRVLGTNTKSPESGVRSPESGRTSTKSPESGVRSPESGRTSTKSPESGVRSPESGSKTKQSDTKADSPPSRLRTMDSGHGTFSSGLRTPDSGPGTVLSGLVPGSTILVGGDPGIGKSTLLLQAAQQLAAQNKRVLYVSSEESAQQTRLRAARLGAHSDELYVLADTNLARIIEQTRLVKPAVVVIDSIQMIYKGDLPAAPGSVTQLRACCMELVYMAKASGIAVFLVGHVTKEGQLAGPRLLEHMVDTVLYFEGDRYHSHRIVRAIKNRFGTTLEVGLFEMGDSGLREVSDGGALFAAEYRPMAGSVVCPVMQGSRCLLVEIQALTATSFLGSAKRKVSGLDSNRLAMLIAVLEKRGGLRLADQDVFASSVGGMKVGEPAADLAIALAIAGAHLNRQIGGGKGRRAGTGKGQRAGGEKGQRAEGPKGQDSEIDQPQISPALRPSTFGPSPSPPALRPSSLGPSSSPSLGTCAVGEIGLGGEIRHVNGLEQRIREAFRLGFSHVLCPSVSMKVPTGCELTHVQSLDDALQMLS